MNDSPKKADRRRRAEGYRSMMTALGDLADTRRVTPSAIFDSLSKAHLDEKSATSSELSRVELLREDPTAGVPDELSRESIARYYIAAAGFYAIAAEQYVSRADLRRAFKYYYRSWISYRQATQWQSDLDPKIAGEACVCREKSRWVRYELARRSVCRRRWSLGMLGRVR